MFPRLALPTLFTIGSTLFFFALERLRPGRKLERVRGWYGRALLVNGAQMAITLGLNRVWNRSFGGASLFALRSLHAPALQGLIAWCVGTFFFYWWHRLRHRPGFWRLFHQLHHSPARIEVLTSFYKHPVEILSDSLLGANFKSPRWLKYVIQTPELHSVHHELDVHRYNYADLPIWDRLFGTYRDADTFAERCGFPRDNERHLGDMLLFRDVYDRP